MLTLLLITKFFPIQESKIQPLLSLSMACPFTKPFHAMMEEISYFKDLLQRAHMLLDSVPQAHLLISHIKSRFLKYLLLKSNALESGVKIWLSTVDLSKIYANKTTVFIKKRQCPHCPDGFQIQKLRFVKLQFTIQFLAILGFQKWQET